MGCAWRVSLGIDVPTDRHVDDERGLREPDERAAEVEQRHLRATPAPLARLGGSSCIGLSHRLQLDPEDFT